MQFPSFIRVVFDCCFVTNFILFDFLERKWGPLATLPLCIYRFRQRIHKWRPPPDRAENFLSNERLKYEIAPKIKEIQPIYRFQRFSPSNHCSQLPVDHCDVTMEKSIFATNFQSNAKNSFFKRFTRGFRFWNQWRNLYAPDKSIFIILARYLLLKLRAQSRLISNVVFSGCAHVSQLPQL